MSGGFSGDHGMMPKRNSKTGKYDRPVRRAKRSGGMFVALVTFIAWFVVLTGSAILLWYLGVGR